MVFTFTDATEASGALARARNRGACGGEAISILSAIGETIAGFGKAELVDGKRIGSDLLNYADIIGARA